MFFQLKHHVKWYVKAPYIFSIGIIEYTNVIWFLIPYQKLIVEIVISQMLFCKYRCLKKSNWIVSVLIYVFLCYFFLRAFNRNHQSKMRSETNNAKPEMCIKNRDNLYRLIIRWSKNQNDILCTIDFILIHMFFI